MNPDGRKGKVLAIRLEDRHRELITRACEVEYQRRNAAPYRERDDEGRTGWGWGRMSLGEFIRVAAIKEAKRLLEAGTTASPATKKKAKRRAR